MSDRTFVDTNVLVYALDEAEPRKREIARKALASGSYGELVLSSQVLGELYVTVTRELEVAISEAEAAEVVHALAATNPIVSVDEAIARDAIETSRCAKLSYWDSLIVASAADAGCARLLTEDLNDGQRIGSVRVENPFRER